MAEINEESQRIGNLFCLIMIFMFGILQQNVAFNRSRADRKHKLYKHDIF